MDIRVDVEGVEKTIDILRKTEPESLKEMRKEIRTNSGLVNVMSSIKSEIPSVAPLSGFNAHSGRTRYMTPAVKPQFNTRKMSGARAEQSLVTIVTAPPSSGVGFEIVDMAGRGPGARTPNGAQMIRNLSKAPSRYVYPGFFKKEEGLTNGVRQILEKYAEKVNIKLKVM